MWTHFVNFTVKLDYREKSNALSRGQKVFKAYRK